MSRAAGGACMHCMGEPGRGRGPGLSGVASCQPLGAAQLSPLTVGLLVLCDQLLDVGFDVLAVGKVAVDDVQEVVGCRGRGTGWWGPGGPAEGGVWNVQTCACGQVLHAVSAQLPAQQHCRQVFTLQAPVHHPLPLCSAAHLGCGWRAPPGLPARRSLRRGWRLQSRRHGHLTAGTACQTGQTPRRRAGG